MHAKAYDATRAVVHDDEHPMGAHDGRFASEQVETPQTVLRVTEDREPGRASGVRRPAVPSGENASHDILVDRDRHVVALRAATIAPAAANHLNI